MDTIRIFSKKTFAIGPGAQRGTSEIEYFQTVPLSFQDMPAKYQNDPTFLAAVRAGEIQVVEKATIVATDKPAPKAKPDTTPAPTPAVPQASTPDTDDEDENEMTEEEYKAALKNMDKDKVREEAKKYNAEFIEDDKLGNNKKRVLEAYKLSLSKED